MKKFALPLMVLALSTGAFANISEDKIDEAELATTLLNCSHETNGLLRGHDFVSGITGKYTKVSNRVSTKVYTVKTLRPFGFGGSMPGPSLVVKLTVTQPPVGSADMPSNLDYVCSVVQK